MTKLHKYVIEEGRSYKSRDLIVGKLLWKLN